MNKRMYGILAGVVGSALGAWWFRRRRADARLDGRGVVIYDNAPVADEGPAVF